MRIDSGIRQTPQLQPSAGLAQTSTATQIQEVPQTQAPQSGQVLKSDQFAEAKSAAPEYTKSQSALMVPEKLNRSRPTMGEPVVVGQKLGPKPANGEWAGDKPASGEHAVVGQRLGPKPANGEWAGDKPTIGEPVVVGQRLGPKPANGEWAGDKPVGGPLGNKQDLDQMSKKPANGEWAGHKPIVGQKMFVGKAAANDTEIKVPEPERKPDTSPWGKQPISEPKNPGMWEDDLGQRNR